ncbi:hypothetical protein [Hyphococcus sp.]|uniref:hypothetical protein n=1 Tax=Hyphococcus sp. TaxID=2038636 RepID=UPI00207F5B03|nr:MAG: hypothetical protein DHS20C04_10150 [Marinicaulis sp.]
MILRRVIAHFRKQEWTAIGLDFLIVVVGVFVGLQVNNWNAARADRELERHYYIQFAGDLRGDIAMAREVAEYTRRNDAHGDYLAAALADPDFVIDDPDYLAMSVARAGYANFPRISRRTLNEVVSTGNLSLLRDEEMRNAILDYYAADDREAQWDSLLRNMQYEYKTIFKGLISREMERRIVRNEALEVSATTAHAILEAARERPGLEDSLSNMAAIEARLLSRSQSIEADAQSVMTIIERRTGESLWNDASPEKRK